MSDAVLTLLKLALLAAVYGFFAWVLWAALGQLRPAPSAATPPPTRPRSASSTRGQITIMEPPELKGAVMPVTDELTIGRAAACTLTLDDTYVSQQHARIVRRDGQHLVDDLGSTNGTFVNRERITVPVVLKPGDRVQIGSTVLEFS
ncbi:MAG: FHA domain-containing protein [Acidimicrobiia bacterium]|nr:FHA domain-containing protein [Acidimicrobiia bacterium]